jgi:NAD(P)H-flavin reductase
MCRIHYWCSIVLCYQAQNDCGEGTGIAPVMQEASKILRNTYHGTKKTSNLVAKLRHDVLPRDLLDHWSTLINSLYTILFCFPPVQRIGHIPQALSFK